MAFHNRGGARAGAGRPAKAPTKLVRIEENLGDKIKDLSKKFEPSFILSKWDSIENLLLHNRPLHQQETHNNLPDNLSKALLNDSLIKLLDKIFRKFSPDDFIAYWEDIDLTEEIEPVLNTTPQKPDIQEITTDLPLFQFQKSVEPITSKKQDTAVEFSEYKISDGSFLTKEQYNILKSVRDRLDQPQKKGLLIEALAGTGKSTMLAEIAKVLKSEKLSPLECRFVVFGRKNKQDLANKLSGIKWEKSVQTLNSLGYEILRDALGKSHKQFRLNNGKYQQIAQQKRYLNSYNQWGEEIKGQLQTKNQYKEIAVETQTDFLDLIDQMRLHCYFLDEITEDNVWEISSKYGIKICKNRLSEITEAACDVLEAGLDEGIKELHIDFIDQSWLLWHDQNIYKDVLKKWSNKLKVISVDECQDTDLLQIEFIKLLYNPSNNFVIACGDKNKAIYSFRGCLTDGIDVIAKKIDCDKMPLTTNWRCGKKHLELVRNIYSHIDIKPSPVAPDGEIRIIKETNFLDIFDGADRSKSFFGICRKNAPLIIFAIRLLTAGYPARIKDRNLGAKLLNKVKEVVRGKYHVDNFLNKVEEWFLFQANSINKLPEKIIEQKLTELRDYRDCLVALFAKFQPKSLNDWKTEIDQIFDESITTKKIIDLYTIHSGKGGEGHYTFIIYPEQMPIEYEKQSKEEKEQEQHMIYIGLTRCLARAKGGILWLVLEEKQDKFSYPKWLPSDYRKLWGETEKNDEEIDADIIF